MSGRSGVDVAGAGTRGRLEGCEIAGHPCSGIHVRDGGHPTLVGCTIRDNAAVAGAGVYVEADARGNVAIGAGNVFARNVGGDVVRL